MGGPTTLIWRGVRVDPRTATMLDEVARLTPDLPVLSPSQGSYNTSVGASAGTHAGGGAVDIRCSNLTASQAVEVVRIMRIVGFAAWRRMPSEGPWPEHIHGIAVGQRDLSAAAARQIDGRNANGDPIGLRNGRNGLANNGPDPHRNLGLPVITWETYQSRQRTPGGTMSTPKQIAEAVTAQEIDKVDGGRLTVAGFLRWIHKLAVEVRSLSSAARSAAQANRTQLHRIEPKVDAIAAKLGALADVPPLDASQVAADLAAELLPHLADIVADEVRVELRDATGIDEESVAQRISDSVLTKAAASLAAGVAGD